MVAYSFKARFAEPILAGTKRQTIRAARKRHARPGEDLQLYTGMRTKQCRLIARATCERVVPIRLVFRRRRDGLAEAVLFVVNGAPLCASDMNILAAQDGFGWSGHPGNDMADFWFENHKGDSDNLDFEGVLISWMPIA